MVCEPWPNGNSFVWLSAKHTQDRWLFWFTVLVDGLTLIAVDAPTRSREDKCDSMPIDLYNERARDISKKIIWVKWRV